MRPQEMGMICNITFIWLWDSKGFLYHPHLKRAGYGNLSPTNSCPSAKFEYGKIYFYNPKKFGRYGVTLSVMLFLTVSWTGCMSGFVISIHTLLLALALHSNSKSHKNIVPSIFMLHLFLQCFVPLSGGAFQAWAAAFVPNARAATNGVTWAEVKKQVAWALQTLSGGKTQSLASAPQPRLQLRITWWRL